MLLLRFPGFAARVGGLVDAPRVTGECIKPAYPGTVAIVCDGSPAAEKRVLRERLRARRRGLGEGELATASRAIAAIAAGVPAIARARTIAGYVAHDGEPDLGAVLTGARERGALVLLPRLAPGGGLDLVPAAAGTALAPGRGGIAEPTGAPLDPTAGQVPATLLAPAVALDAAGRRLGRGGGHYDRLVGRLRALGWTIVGVCHAWQIVERLPEEPHDEAVDAILTDVGFRTIAGDRGGAGAGC